MSGLINRQAAISEEKMQIVINNYFKSECNVDTSIRQAFEKGFRIGVKKGLTVQPERKKGEWTRNNSCPFCGFLPWYESDVHTLSFCPNCGSDMRGEQGDEQRSSKLAD